MEFKERLKELRAMRGVTQQQVADYLKTSYQHYQRYERGVQSPRLEHLAALADYFGVSIDYLAGRSNDPTRLP